MPDRIQEILLRQIDLEDGRYGTRYCREVSASDLIDVKASVLRSGIINPPVVSAEKDGFVIVSGRKRLLAATELGEKSVLCRVTDASPVDAYIVAITENAYSGDYSELDKALIVSRLHAFMRFGSSDVILECLSCIKGMKMNKGYLDRLFRINALSENLKNAMSEGWVSPSVVLEYGFFQNDDAEVVIDHLRALRLGLNLQREFCNLLFELSRINECSATYILMNLPDMDIHASDLEPARRREAVMSELRKQRYPNIEKARSVFTSNVKKITGKESPVSFSPPRNPDSSEITVSFSFKTVDGFMNGSEELSRIAKSGMLSDILMFNS